MGNIKRYTEEELTCIKQHILKSFGHPMHVLHDKDKDLNIDIYIIPPTDEADYYVLLTMGMGEYVMDTPEEAADKKLSRAELMLLLPGDWDIASTELKFDWPFRWLRVLANLPYAKDSWLGYGHAVANEEPFAENTALSGFVLASPSSSEENAKRCVLPDGDVINFYLAIPIYKEEMDLQEAEGSQALFQKFGSQFSVITDINRKNYCLE